MPQLNFDGPPKSEVTDFQLEKFLRFVSFRALDTNFHLALQPKVLWVDMKESPHKSTQNNYFGGESFLSPQPRLESLF